MNDPSQPALTDAPPKKRFWLGVLWELRAWIEAFAFALTVVVVFSTVAYARYAIPSESMQPHMEVGDNIVVSKFAYGFSRWSIPFAGGAFLPETDKRLFESPPKQGDVAVFRHLTQKRDLVKRIIGLPGDLVELRQGRLYINETLIERQSEGQILRRAPSGELVQLQAYVETLPNGVRHHIYEYSDDAPFDNFGPARVPPRTFFAMGDNRDFSADSRVPGGPGFVPYERLAGRADLLLFTFFRCKDNLPQERCKPARSLRGFHLARQ